MGTGGTAIAERDGRPVGRAGPSRERTGSRRARRQRASGGTIPYLMIAPFLLLFLVFFVAPIVYAGYLSLFVDRLIGGQVFVGMDNYVRVLGDDGFREGLLRVI